MSITKERFESGLTYAQYKAQMSRNQETLIENEDSADLDPSELTWFAQLPASVNVLVITEDWCGDAIAALPVLARLADESQKLNLRIFLRDQNLDIMDQYLKEGKYRAIPVFAFFEQSTSDGSLNELCYFIERPRSISEQMESMRADLFVHDPLFANVEPDTDFGELPDAARSRLMETIGTFRREQRAFFNRELVREVRSLLGSPAS